MSFFFIPFQFLCKWNKLNSNVDNIFYLFYITSLYVVNLVLPVAATL